jgi:hypothetical protein
MSTPSYDEIRHQVERRYRRTSVFIYHLIIAFVSLASIWYISRDGRVAIVMTLLWGGLLALHFVRLVTESAKDRAIERTWRRYYGDFDYEKPKNALYLTDDAELELIEDDEPERKYLRR